MKVLYTAEASMQGGCDGQVHTADRHLTLNLSVPKEMGGPDGGGTNPVQLFAAGYAACFQSALLLTARRQHIDASVSTVTVKTSIAPSGEGAFGFAVELHVFIPDVDQETGAELVRGAHKVCPYSNATRGNIPVNLYFEEQPLAI